MRHPIKSTMFVGAFLFGLLMCFTSCEDILGKWEKPVPQVPETVVEEAKVLGEALEAGATVTINYTVENQSYIAIFQKNSDDTYTLISNTAAPATTRAMTRGLAQLVTTGDGATVGDKVQLKLVGNKLVLIVKDYTGIPLFEAQMNVAGGEVTVTNTNAIGINGSIGAVSINDQEKGIKNPEMQSVIIQNSDVSYAVKYSEGETWANVVDRYKNNESVEITTTTDGYVSIKFSKEIVVNALMANGYRETAAESEYTNEYSGSFYLTEGASNARAMTRAARSTYVKATDAVGAHDMYRLIPAPVALSAVTSHIGWVIGSDGKAYAKERYLPEGTDAVAMIAYVGSDNGESAPYNHGLALALEDVSGVKKWCSQTSATCLGTGHQFDSEAGAKGDMAGIDNTDVLVGTTPHNHGDNAASAARNYNSGAHPTGTSAWFLPSAGQWDKMVTAAGGYNNLKEYADLQSGGYWSSTECNSSLAWGYNFGSGNWFVSSKDDGSIRVRACLAF